MNLFPSFVIDKRRFYSQNSTHLFVVLPNKRKGVRVSNNYVHLILIGLCLGVTLGIAVIPLFDSFECHHESGELPDTDSAPVGNRLNAGKIMVNESQIKSFNALSRPMNMRRPRFYSTELGLRKKLIVGIVLTDFTRLDNLLAINSTLSPSVGQTLFFVVGQSLAMKVRGIGLSNVVALPDNYKFMGIGRTKSVKKEWLRLDRPMFNNAALRVLKYFGGKVVDSYDYFFLGLDVFYINGRELINAMKQISISQDFLWGITEEGTGCSLEKGIVMSRSMIKKLYSRIDRCFQRSLLTMSNNLTTCFQYALGSGECSAMIQNQTYLSVSGNSSHGITKAISIGPLLSSEEFFQLHTKIAHERMIEIGQDIKNSVLIIDAMVPHIPKDFDICSWPKGLPIAYKPLTRFDFLKWKYFTLNKIFPRNEHITENTMGGIDKLDIHSLINVSAHYLRDVLHKKEDSAITFQYGYRRFDETRGMEYLLDFTSNTDGQFHRVECLRPLSNVEVVPMPFVTENRRLTVIMPVLLDQYNQTNDFLKNYFDMSLDKKSNSVLILALIVDESNIQMHPTASQLHLMKQLISNHNSNHNKIDNGTTMSLEPLKVGYVVINMKQFKTSNVALALFDTLAGRVLSPNALVLVIDSFVVLKDEFLNRVRMNTILNNQVFSPIPFREYNSRLSGFISEVSGLGIHKSTGYFDSEYFGCISFFIVDYIAARKQSSNIPVVKQAAKKQRGVSIIPSLFLRGSKLHVLRAPEPSLKITFPRSMFENCLNGECFDTLWGFKADLAKLILNQ